MGAQMQTSSMMFFKSTLSLK